MCQNPLMFWFLPTYHPTQPPQPPTHTHTHIHTPPWCPWWKQDESPYDPVQWSYTWWHYQMDTFFALLALLSGNSLVTGEFPAVHRPVTRSFDVFFVLCVNIRLNKQSWDWWFGTPQHSLWRHCDEFSLWRHQMETFSALLALCLDYWDHKCCTGRNSYCL